MGISKFQPVESTSLCRFCKKSPKECENTYVKTLKLDKVYEYKDKTYYNKDYQKRSKTKRGVVKFKGGINYPFLLMCDYFYNKRKTND